MEKRNHLPWDMIEEILSRVPAKSLARLRSASKQWNSLLKSGSFAKMHSANAPKEAQVIMLIKSRVNIVRINLQEFHNNVAPSAKVATFHLKDPLLDSSQAEISKIFHCDGLLLCTTQDNRLVVWNPCLGETKWIQPNGKTYTESDNFVLGYDNKSSCKKYKILRVYSIHPNDGFNYAYEIYDCILDSWQVLCPSKDWCFNASRRPISMKGNAYWVAFYTAQVYHYVLLSFDFSTKKFQNLSLPHDLTRRMALSEFREEQLCLFGTSIGRETGLHVWVTTSTGPVISWSKFLTVQKNFERDNSSIYDGVSFLTDDKNKVVVCCNDYMFTYKFLHIVGENKFVSMYPHGVDSTYISPRLALFNYVPSLSQIQQGSRPRGRKRKAPST